MCTRERACEPPRNTCIFLMFLLRRIIHPAVLSHVYIYACMHGMAWHGTAWEYSIWLIFISFRFHRSLIIILCVRALALALAYVIPSFSQNRFSWTRSSIEWTCIFQSDLSKLIEINLSSMNWMMQKREYFNETKRHGKNIENQEN